MPEDVEEDIHPHCLGCINLKKCTARSEQGISCEITACVLACGLSFHRCKKNEHKLLCLNEKVPCYNAENGCPCIMQRKLLASHLTICPASVIHCTMEWNRWHIDPTSEEKLQRCTHAMRLEHPQLDVALALRDQRMLRQWYSSNKNARNALRNYFKTNPAQLYVETLPEIVPSSPNGANETTKTEASSTTVTPTQESTPPGLQRSVCNQLHQPYEGSKNDFIAALSSGKINGGSNSGESGIFSDEENKENWVNYLQNHKSSQYNHRDYKETANCCYSSNCDCWCRKDEKSDESCDIGTIEKVNLDRVLRIKDNTDIIYFDEDMVSAIMSFPTRYLGLGPNLESSGYSSKHTMYTFLCCQEFRRDEYPWHYKNVHSEIHDGLNGWLQERCPLAQYGCTFSRQRLHPKPKGSKIVYNEVLESFGIAPATFEHKMLQNGEEIYSSNHHKVSPHQGINIFLLPFEVLQHIARFLDSFSLSNLALTSSLMREVCQSLLVERGIVALHWERQKESNGFCWRITHKRWFYSSHFTPVKEWVFDDCCSMSNHLKKCIYFDRNQKVKPYYFPMGCPRDSSIYKKMSDSVLDTNCSFENVITKL